MCGIIGYFGENSSLFKEKISLKDISHRGPDFSDFISDKNFYLGHTRLSILDLSNNGNQPMFSSDRNCVIIFNGEIYNHQELRKNLETKYNFISSSDTETLLYGLIEEGVDFIKKLNGIFSFSFFNTITEKFIVARDHFGVKPLYYHVNKSGLCFSSELKALVNFLPKTTINQAALKNYLNFLWSPGEATPLNEVKKLLPGHLISGELKQAHKSKIIKYYKLKFDNKIIINKSENYLVNKLDEYLVNAVKRQMLSDVPVGFFLSGGLDSSLIVAIARKLYPNKKIKCFTIKTDGVEDEGFINDLFYAKEVANILNLDLTIVDGNSNILEFFDKVIYHLDEPQADPAPINVYNICKVAKNHGIKVLIGGTAGDDLFSGYRRHKALALEKYYKLIPMFVKRLLNYFIKKLNSKSPFKRRIKKLFKDIEKDKNQRLHGYFDWIDEKSLNGLFLNDNNFDQHKYFKKLTKEIPEDTSDLNKMLYYELNTFLVDHNLNYTDKLSMATGVEVRVPYLDKELVEFSTRIPTNMKMKNNQTKYILKKVAENYLPKKIIYRPKTGFGAPVRKWILNDMDKLISEYLKKDVVENRQIFKYDKIKDLVEKNKNKIEDFSYTIWSLLAIESWMRQFFDNN